MGGNTMGGQTARNTILAKYGKDWYAKIGRIGGKNKSGGPQGFAANKELARRAGAIGGRVSRRRAKGVL